MDVDRTNRFHGRRLSGRRGRRDRRAHDDVGATIAVGLRDGHRDVAAADPSRSDASRRPTNQTSWWSVGLPLLPPGSTAQNRGGTRTWDLSDSTCRMRTAVVATHRLGGTVGALPGPRRHRRHPGARVDDTQAAAIDAVDGRILWDRSTTERTGSVTAIRDDRVVLTDWRENETTVIDIVTGEVRYQVDGQDSRLAEPTLFTITATSTARKWAASYRATRLRTVPSSGNSQTLRHG